MHLLSIVFIEAHLFYVLECINKEIAMGRDGATAERYGAVYFNVLYRVTMSK